jgi:hypothetical protein
MGAILDEARRFLSLPPPESTAYTPTPAGSPEAARRLFAASKPIAGTLAEAYLHRRGITEIRGITALRFHPNCYYRTEEGTPEEVYTGGPALIAAVTALDGTIMGLQRTWLDPAGGGKLRVEAPRRAMGHLLGHAVRFGVARDVMTAGEGIETVLSPRSCLPTMPTAAALSAGHLAALLFPSGLRRLYILRDNDRAGHLAAEKLTARAQAAGIETIVLVPTRGDFNDDLRQLGPDALAAALRMQLSADDVSRFWIPPSLQAGR